MSSNVASTPSTSTCSSLSSYLSTHPDFQSPNSPSSPLPSLYSDLSRQKRSNPSGYRANVEWWKIILTRVVANGIQSNPTLTSKDRQSTSGSENENVNGSSGTSDRLVLHVDESMRQNWTVDQVGRPLGLGTVIVSNTDRIDSLPRMQCSKTTFQNLNLDSKRKVAFTIAKSEERSTQRASLYLQCQALINLQLSL